MAGTLRWCEKEEEYLRLLHESCDELSKEFMKVYVTTLALQTRLRLPTIVLSSISGVASFGTGTFPESFRSSVSIMVGVINIGIAIVQTYESYLKIADTVAHSLAASKDLKKLSDDIHCEIFIPVDDRISSGIVFLRESFGRYQAILETSPPLQHKTDRSIVRRSEELKQRLSSYVHTAPPAPATTPVSPPASPNKPHSPFDEDESMIEIRTMPAMTEEPASPPARGGILGFRSRVRKIMTANALTSDVNKT